MLQLVTVPLDGSAFGEQALPVAIRLAERDNARIEIVHVYETDPPYMVSGVPPIDPGLDIELQRDRAEYLKDIAKWLSGETKVPVQSTVLSGQVGPTLSDHINRSGTDLVVMVSHGRSGLSSVFLGSTATDVIRHVHPPSLLLRPDPNGSRVQPSRPFLKVVIPLDGSSEAEPAIDNALAVAGESGVEFCLLHVRSPMIFLSEPPVGIPVATDLDLRSFAIDYLEGIAERIRSKGFECRTRVEIDVGAAPMIMDVANEISADLIAMETHGRGGLMRLIFGSVADKVVRSASVPVLIQRPRVDLSIKGELKAASR